jgi:hypothetical protein
MPQPRIALFDIETAPSLGYFWGKLWETDIIGVDTPWYMLCFSYKWLSDKTIYTHALPDYKRYKKDKEDDTDLAKDLHSLFDEADILIAHNGDRFDIRKANARFIRHGWKPPATYKSIDTLKVARRHFLFDSNRLNDLGEFLGVGKKIPHTGFDLWKRAMAGDEEAWRQMKAYNRRDVVLLEKVYERLRPYMPNHPNLTLYTDSPDCCPTCNSKHIQRRGFAVKSTRLYRRFQCRDCGGWFSSRKSIPCQSSTSTPAVAL